MVSRLAEFKRSAAEMAAQEQAKKSQAAQGEMADLTERHHDVGERMMLIEQELRDIGKKIKIQQEGLSGIIEELRNAEGDEEAKGMAAQNEELQKQYDKILAELQETITESESAIQGNEEAKTNIEQKIESLKQEEQKIAGRAAEIMGVKEYPFARLWEYVTEKKVQEHKKAQANYYGGYFVNNYLGGYLRDLQEKQVTFNAEKILERWPLESRYTYSEDTVLNDPAVFNEFAAGARKKFDELFPKLSDEIRRAIEQKGTLTIDVKNDKREVIAEAVLYEKGKFPDAKEVPEDPELAGMSAEAKAVIARAVKGEIAGLTEKEKMLSLSKPRSYTIDDFKNEMRQAGMDKEVVGKMMAQAQAENKEIDAAKQRANLETVAQKDQELNEKLKQLKTAYESGRNLIKQFDSYEEAKKNLDNSHLPEKLTEIPNLITIHQDEITGAQAEMDKLPRSAKIPFTNIGGGIKDKTAEKQLQREIDAENNKISNLRAQLHDAKTQLETLNAELLRTKTELLRSEPRALQENGKIALGLRSVINTRQGENMDKQQEIAREIAQNEGVGRLWQEGKYLDLSPQEVEFVMSGERGASSLLTAMANDASFAIRNPIEDIERQVLMLKLSRDKIPAKYEFSISPDGVMSSDFGGHITDNLGRNNDNWKRLGQLNSKKLQRMLASEIKKNIDQNWRDKVEIKFVD